MPSVVTVKFPSSNIMLVGNLFVPGVCSKGMRQPAIVVIHPGGGVKEQTAGIYAKALADHGFITLAFDRRTQGESEGTPRNLEDPFDSVEDIKSAITYLTIHEKVDPLRIGVLGICAGGGYGLDTVANDFRTKAVATVSAVDIGRLFAKSLPADALGTLLVKAGEGRSIYAKGEEVKYLPYIPTVTEDSPTLIKEAHDYYLTPRGAHPRSLNRFVDWSYDTIAAYDAFLCLERISPRPLLMVAGSIADTAEHSRIAIEKAGKHPDKELYYVEGATHVSLYDRDVPKVLPKLFEFFDRTL
ncbi:hypothetical protein FBU30_006073 [Linnemannia zychae]|nr:hypothetical protein FBU30_006073 [Linnemannia zychae]